MSGSNWIREYFPGGNTCQGFYSLYSALIKKGSNRTYIFKGGPGTGKSTIIKKIGNALYNEGYNVEFYYCSSDSNSLDGLAVPDLGTVILDGTTPHVIEPEVPGARDEIINLGAYWNEEVLRPYMREIENLQNIISDSFNLTYRYLKEAKLTYENWQFYHYRCLNKLQAAQNTVKLLDEIFEGIPAGNALSKEQHLFASAITPEGPVNKYSSVLQNISNLYLLMGDPGTGKSTMLQKMYHKAQEKGLTIEAYHCGFSPERLDALVLPEINLAVVKNTYPHIFSLSRTQYLEKISNYDLSTCLDKEKLKSFEPDIEDARERFWHLIGKAVRSIKNSKRNHDLLERYYVRAQNFDKLNKLADDILQKILKYKV